MLSTKYIETGHGDKEEGPDDKTKGDTSGDSESPDGTNTTKEYSPKTIENAKKHLADSDGLLKKLVDKFCKFYLFGF